MVNNFQNLILKDKSIFMKLSKCKKVKTKKTCRNKGIKTKDKEKIVYVAKSKRSITCKRTSRQMVYLFTTRYNYWQGEFYIQGE